MALNPFHAEESAGLGEMLAQAARADIGKKGGPDKETEQAQIVEERVLGALCAKDSSSRAGRTKKAGRSTRIERNDLVKSIRVRVREAEVREVEEKIRGTRYFQVPENESVRKEESEAFRAVFSNWRKGLGDVIVRYRKECKRGEEGFSFYIYYEGSVYYFHTWRYNKCAEMCCAEDKKYALVIRGGEEGVVETSEVEHLKESGKTYVRGVDVLYILDELMNYKESSVRPLPLVFSKHEFFNGLMTRPEMVVHGEMRSDGAALYRVELAGWMDSNDFVFLNRQN